MLLPAAARAQAPAWATVNTGTPLPVNGDMAVTASTTDASGNVFMTGAFKGTVRLGNAVLVSAGEIDLFVAKYSAVSRAWLWAVRGGGTQSDVGRGIAVSGTGVYVTGSITNRVSNLANVTFSQSDPSLPAYPQSGTSPAYTPDLVVVKYEDQGSAARVAWAQVGGGAADDEGNGIAVSGTSVYVTGYISNDATNLNHVVFGGTGTTPGTVQVNGTNTRALQIAYPDVLVAKYEDQGTSAALRWTQVGGGEQDDRGNGIAVSGTSVYVTGYISNNAANVTRVLFGASGTTPGTVQVNGASAGSFYTRDLVVAKYVDNGGSASLGWTQVGGGVNSDAGQAVAVAGTSVYVAGSITNNLVDGYTVRFGGTGTTAGTVAQAGASATLSQDWVLASYTDQGTAARLDLTRVAGGTDAEEATGVAVGAGGQVYVIGALVNDQADSRAVRFGGTGTTAGTVAVPGVRPPRTNSASLDRDVAVARFSGSAPAPDWVRVALRPASWGVSVSVGPGIVVNARPALSVQGSAVYVSDNLDYASLAGTPPAQSPLLALVAELADGGTTATWQPALAPPETGGVCIITGTAADANGNVFVTGAFTGLLQLGNNIIRDIYSSSGGTSPWGSLFVAKYVPATNTWAWVQQGGGAGSDAGLAIAVSGNSVYVTGYIENDLQNINRVGFSDGSGGTRTQLGASAPAAFSLCNDLVVVKYVDNGATATLAWTQVAGGSGCDQGNGIAVSGPNVYVTGNITNTQGDAQAVRFGGTGTTAGTLVQAGADPQANTLYSDLVLAKYEDQGSTARVAWTQVAGGTGADVGQGVAVNGTSVYVTGSLLNTRSDVRSVRFGGTGTTAGTLVQAGADPQANTPYSDLVLAKYEDQGSTARVAWTQVAGGTGDDAGYGLAVNGTSVYVTGKIINTQADGSSVRFGGAGTTAGTLVQAGADPQASTRFPDLVLAKYEDQGSTARVAWTQVGGGRHRDFGRALAVQGASVYVTGSVGTSSADAGTVRFGGSGTTAGTVVVNGATASYSDNVLVAMYTDNGPTAALSWTQVGGGGGGELITNAPAEGAGNTGTGIVVTGNVVRVGGHFVPSPVSRFGNFSFPAFMRYELLPFVGTLAATTGTAVTGAARLSGVALYPNPARAGGATLVGAPAGAAVQVLDALGRLVATATADAQGTAVLRLPAGTRAGVYVVRVGTQARRLLVE